MKTFKIIAEELQQENELNEIRVIDELYKKITDSLTYMKREGSETKQMLEIFIRELKSNLKGNKSPSPKELQFAIKQLKDVGKLSVLVPLLIMPGSIITVPVLEKLLNKFDLSIFPDSHISK